MQNINGNIQEINTSKIKKSQRLLSLIEEKLSRHNSALILTIDASIRFDNLTEHENELKI